MCPLMLLDDMHAYKELLSIFMERTSRARYVDDIESQSSGLRIRRTFQVSHLDSVCLSSLFGSERISEESKHCMNGIVATNNSFTACVSDKCYIGISQSSFPVHA